MNALKMLRARLRDMVLNIAVRIDDHDDLRMCARLWSHAGPRPAWVLFGSLPMLPFVYGQTAPVILLVAVALILLAGSRLADRTHEVGWIDRVHPCPLCPTEPGGDDGHGGGGWNGDGFPTAPPPMDDFDDYRIRNWAGDLDGQLLDLIADTRRSETGGAL